MRGIAKAAHCNNRLHGSCSVEVFVDLEKSAKDSGIDLKQLFFIKQLRGFPLKNGAQKESTANNVEWIAFFICVLRIRAEHIEIPLQPTEKVRAFSLFKLLLLLECLDRVCSAASKDKNSSSDRMGELPLLKLTILHGGQKEAQPAKYFAIKLGIKLIPKYKGDFAG